MEAFQPELNHQGLIIGAVLTVSRSQSARACTTCTCVSSRGLGWARNCLQYTEGTGGGGDRGRGNGDMHVCVFQGVGGGQGIVSSTGRETGEEGQEEEEEEEEEGDRRRRRRETGGGGRGNGDMHVCVFHGVGGGQGIVSSTGRETGEGGQEEEEGDRRRRRTGGGQEEEGDRRRRRRETGGGGRQAGRTAAVGGLLTHFTPSHPGTTPCSSINIVPHPF